MAKKFEKDCGGLKPETIKKKTAAPKTKKKRSG